MKTVNEQKASRERAKPTSAYICFCARIMDSTSCWSTMPAKPCTNTSGAV